MGDGPVFTCRCHVFKIDANTKKTWLPAADGSVQVSFFYDPSKRAYRVVSIYGGKPIINSTIVAGMTFSRTAQKFGQWSDQRANTVYGVGFNNEDELTKFADQFEQAKACIVRENLSPVGAPPTLESYTAESPVRVMSPVLSAPVNHRPHDTDSNRGFKRSSDDECSRDGSLSLENEKLKASLLQSQSNLKKWEIELQTLRTNNSRLQSALQENSKNVEEWKSQILQYREENSKLRTRNEELELEVENIHKSGTQSPKMNKKQSKGALKSEEVERVKQILEKVTAELVEAKEENTRLKSQMNGSQERNGISQQAYENSMVCQLQADMEIRLRELTDMNRKLLTYCRKT